MKDNNASNSSVKIGSGNKFEGDTVIGENAKIIKNTKIVDNSQNYEVDAENVTFVKHVSPYLINKFGKQKTGMIGAINSVAAIITLLTWINSTNSSERLFPIIPVISQNYASWAMWTGIALLLVGSIFLNAVNYHSSTKCKQCSKDFAYKELGTAKVRDIETVDGTRRTIKRKYKCQFCGHLDERTTNKLFEKEEDESYF